MRAKSWFISNSPSWPCVTTKERIRISFYTSSSFRYSHTPRIIAIANRPYGNGSLFRPIRVYSRRMMASAEQSGISYGKTRWITISMIWIIGWGMIYAWPSGVSWMIRGRWCKTRRRFSRWCPRYAAGWRRLVAAYTRRNSIASITPRAWNFSARTSRWIGFTSITASPGGRQHNDRERRKGRKARWLRGIHQLVSRLL